MSLLLRIIATDIKENIITKLQKLYSLPRNPRAGNKSPKLFVKKPLCTGNSLPTLKILKDLVDINWHRTVFLKILFAQKFYWMRWSCQTIYKKFLYFWASQTRSNLKVYIYIYLIHNIYIYIYIYNIYIYIYIWRFIRRKALVQNLI